MVIRELIQSSQRYRPMQLQAPSSDGSFLPQFTVPSWAGHRRDSGAGVKPYAWGSSYPSGILEPYEPT